MIAVLINAYACGPDMGSEPGMAWNWIINLAKYCKVYVITEGEWKNEIEAAVVKLPQSKNIRFYYNPVTERIRAMCWNQGDWRFYYYYRRWQRKTLEIARNVIAENHVDLIHHLNIIGFREPGYLWKLENKPFIWGPVDAKVHFPVNYLKGANIKTIIIILLKNILNSLQLRGSLRVIKAIHRSEFIVSASSESFMTFKKYFHFNSVLMNETGCYANNQPVLSDNYSDNFNILWIGKFAFRKQLELALKSIAELDYPDLRLHILGDVQNPEGENYKALAMRLHIDNKCIWYGIVPHEKVQEIMRKSNLLLFTSVAEGTPHVVLEAIENNLPILCFNTCGQGDSVDNKVGMKIELSNPNQSIKDFAEKIRYLYNNREILLDFSKNCLLRQQELSWNVKTQKMADLYTKAIDNFNASHKIIA